MNIETVRTAVLDLINGKRKNLIKLLNELDKLSSVDKKLVANKIQSDFLDHCTSMIAQELKLTIDHEHKTFLFVKILDYLGCNSGLVITIDKSRK